MQSAKHNLLVVEDAAQLMELSQSNLKFKFETPKAGNLSVLFLVLSGKIWGIGDGGAIVTNDSALAKIIFSSQYGSETKYYNDYAGVNS
jgi:dTDP-4-amino-4,6-dideoxygalactose transaminase